MEDKYRIMKLSFYTDIKIQSKWLCTNLRRGKYSKKLPLIDTQELQFRKVIGFCFIILNIYFL